MDIRELQYSWHQFGATDPLWAILSDPHKKGNRWSVAEFFDTGEKHIAETMAYIESLGLSISRRKALDFGCGVGRLTQSLAGHFAEVYGIDIAPSMIELARKYNRHGARCSYYVNTRDDLVLLNEHRFDFVYTVLTLQHMPPALMKRYLSEFLRLLHPHGLLMFHVPSQRVATADGTEYLDAPAVTRARILLRKICPTAFLSLYRKARRLLGHKREPAMAMYGMTQNDVVHFLHQSGARLLDVSRADWHHGWIGFRYCVTKGHLGSRPSRRLRTSSP